MKKNKAFTLIELLVVISVIGLLASVILISLNSARGKARNAKRNADMKQMANAFILGLDSNNGSFPDSGGWACISASCYGSWVGITEIYAVDDYLASYVAQKPSDPFESGRGFGGYLYAIAWGPAVSPYDSGFYPLGTYLDWMVELPLSSGSCGIGRVY